jgi:site-specific DNA recombinase
MRGFTIGGNNMTIKSAALYARVSSKLQAEHGHSLESQIAACQEKAKEIGAETVKEYIDDGYSGAYLERPALDNLRDAVRDKLYDAVIVYDPDRLSRNLAHQLLLTEEFEKLGAKLIFVSTELKDTPEGKMLYQMRGVFAAYEREKFRERSMRGRRSMAKKGLIVQDSHVYGYDFDKENRRYIINEAEAKIIRLIYDLYINQKIGGLSAILRYLNENNIPSPMGKRWGKATLRDVLSRRMYAGEYHSGRIYHTNIDANHERKILRPKSEWIQIDVPAILPKADVDRAIALLEANKTGKFNKYETEPVLLQGLIYCLLCGRLCTVASGQHRQKKKKVLDNRLRYYSCKRTDYYGAKSICPARLLPARELDELVWNTLKEICKSKTSLAKYIKAKPKQTVKPPSTEKLKAKLERLATERKTVMTWFSKNLIDQDEATEKLAAIRQQEDSIKKKLSAVAIQEPEPEPIDLDGIVRAIRDCPDDVLSRREILRSIVDRVYAKRTDTNKQWRLPKSFQIKIVFKQK